MFISSTLIAPENENAEILTQAMLDISMLEGLQTFNVPELIDNTIASVGIDKIKALKE